MTDKDDFKNAVSAVNTFIPLGTGISIDAYILPNGNVRYGTGYLSILLGYGKDYFVRATKNESKKLRDLIYLGYTGDLIPVKAPRLGTRGVTRAKTISFDDFCILVEYEAIEERNPKAIALLTASFRELLRSRTQVAFDLSEDTLEQKQSDFTDTFHEREVVWNDYLADDKEDIENLALPGDEPHLENGYWNRSFRDAS